MNIPDVDIATMLARLSVYAREKGILVIHDEETKPMVEAHLGAVESFRQKTGLQCVATFQGKPDRDTPAEVRELYREHLFYRAQMTLRRDGRPFSRCYTMNVRPNWEGPIEPRHILFDFLQECRGGLVGIENVIPFITQMVEPATLEWFNKSRALLVKKAQMLFQGDYPEFINLGLPEGTYGDEETDDAGEGAEEGQD